MLTHPSRQSPDLLEQIPDPEIVRGWLAESIKQSELLRSLLRLAVRKAAYRRTSGTGYNANGQDHQEGSHGR
jgi:hypothetical protein